MTNPTTPLAEARAALDALAANISQFNAELDYRAADVIFAESAAMTDRFNAAERALLADIPRDRGDIARLARIAIDYERIAGGANWDKENPIAWLTLQMIADGALTAQ